MSHYSQVLFEMLQDRSVLSSLPSDALHGLAYLMRRVDLEEGDVLFSEGDEGDEAFVIVEGSIEISVRLAGGRSTVRATLGPGQLFGELALFGEGRRAATATARGFTRLAALGHDQLIALIRAWPEAGTALLRVQTQRFLDVEAELRGLLSVSGAESRGRPDGTG